MTFRKILAGFVLSTSLVISSITTVFALSNRSESGSGSFGTIPWTASNKLVDNQLSATLSISYYYRYHPIEVVAVAKYEMQSGNVMTSKQSSGVCYETASTDTASKRIYLSGTTPIDLYSENYIDGSLCKKLILYP